jgi:hypothetical protein
MSASKEKHLSLEKKAYCHGLQGSLTTMWQERDCHVQQRSQANYSQATLACWPVSQLIVHRWQQQLFSLPFSFLEHEKGVYFLLGKTCAREKISIPCIGLKRKRFLFSQKAKIKRR